MTIGFVLASVSVLGVLKTAAAVAVGFPLVVLFVPLLDTSFVIARRLKHGQAPWRADSGHLHHRFARIGWGQRQAALLLYAWCTSLAGFALAIRFVHYRDRASVHWARRAARRAGLLALAFTLYVVYVLEILKQRHLHLVGLARRSEVPARRRSWSRGGSAATAWRPVADRRTKTARSGRLHRAKRHRVPHGHDSRAFSALSRSTADRLVCSARRSGRRACRMRESRSPRTMPPRREAAPDMSGIGAGMTIIGSIVAVRARRSVDRLAAGHSAADRARRRRGRAGARLLRSVAAILPPAVSAGR